MRSGSGISGQVPRRAARAPARFQRPGHSISGRWLSADEQSWVAPAERLGIGRPWLLLRPGRLRAGRAAAMPTFVLAVLALCTVVFALWSDPRRPRSVVLGRNWPAAERVSIDEIDHRPWDGLLRRFVDERGNVNYAGWHESPADVQALDGYLSALSYAEPEREASRAARLSFWINAYNALTIRGILREYPVAGVVHDEARRNRFDFWSDLLLHVGGRDYSLGQIEHELLRPMREPRIHFALVCGARGCPRLLNRAYRTDQLERQLQGNARSFFADPEKMEYERSSGRLRLSPILKWYARDFGDSEAEVLETIEPYLPDRVTRQRPATGRFSTEYLDYDWSLNGQTAPTLDAPVPP